MNSGRKWIFRFEGIKYLFPLIFLDVYDISLVLEIFYKFNEIKILHALFLSFKLL